MEKLNNSNIQMTPARDPKQHLKNDNPHIEVPPRGGDHPRRAATSQLGYRRLLPAGMCGLALLVGDMTTPVPVSAPGPR